MGGGGGNDSANKSNDLLQEQIDTQKQQETEKKAQLSQQEFGIIKSQGVMNWDGKTPTGITSV